MFFAIGLRQAAHVSLEVASKRTVIVKAAFESDFGNGFAVLAQLVGRDQGPKANDIFAWTDPEALFEQSFELPLGQAGLFREFGDGETGCVIQFDEAHHFYHRIMAVFFVLLVILDDSADSFDLSV